MDRIQQDGIDIVQDKKTVDWLVQHTSVRVFDPLTFKGYQRKVDKKHCAKLVEYLRLHFYLPTSIICASDEIYSDDEELRIVDGQHRVCAFQDIKEKYPERYDEIRDKELSVLVLEAAGEEVEIDTFININKTSKKVDTSLAFVLKNKMNYEKAGADLSISRREYVAVELARLLNGNGEDDTGLWANRICYEGSIKNTNQLISLNAFVRSMRTLLASIERSKAVKLEWNTSDEAAALVEQLGAALTTIWAAIQAKWPSLFDGDLDSRRIIQGSIGFTSINRFLGLKLKDTKAPLTMDALTNHACHWVETVDLPSTVWLPGGEFSKYSSERGFSYIAQDLADKST